MSKVVTKMEFVDAVASATKLQKTHQRLNLLKAQMPS